MHKIASLIFSEKHFKAMLENISDGIRIKGELIKSTMYADDERHRFRASRISSAQCMFTVGQYCHNKDDDIK